MTQENVSNVIEIKNKEQFAGVISSPILTIVDFWAEWCGPCRMMVPVLHKIAKDHPEIQLATVNVDECQDLAMDFSVNSIPAVFFIKNGQIVDSFVWAMPEDEVLRKLEANK